MAGGFLNGDESFSREGDRNGENKPSTCPQTRGFFSLKWLSEIRSAYGFVLDSSLLEKSVHFCIIRNGGRTADKEMAMEVHYRQDRDFAKTEICHTNKKKENVKKKNEEKNKNAKLPKKLVSDDGEDLLCSLFLYF